MALTRAKEKLIMIGTTAKSVPAQEGQQEPVRGSVLLPPSDILSSSGCLQLILRAVSDDPDTGSCILIKSINSSELKLNDTWDRIQLELRKNNLEKAMLAAGSGPDGLREQFSWRYPREDMSQLYTKTSVSEQKRAWNNEESGADADNESAGRLFAPEPAPLCLPRFILDEKAEGIPDGKERETETVQLAGAGRGSAVHSILEMIDFEKWHSPGEITKEQFLKWAGELISSGRIPKEYAQVLDPSVFLPFLHSSLAGRMALAQKKGLLRREQPFVLGIDAKRLNADFPEDETVLIQGIIDAFFIEDDRIVIIDYKTDRVRSEQVLVDRYRLQLDYYAEALERILKKPVKEKIIYSFALKKEVPLT